MMGNLFRSRVAILVLFEFAFTACWSEAGPVPAPQAKTTQPSTTAAPATAAAPAVTQTSWTADALEELLAPIALYPDQLLGQILAASVNSQEVLDAGNWLLQNEKLKGNELDAAAQKAGFGPAMRALVQYPSVVDMMCQEIDWTKQLGSAFNSDQKSVLDAVQRLRKEAADVGNLKSTPQQTVATKSEGGNVYIEVKPADPKIVYVPQYDPQVVYSTPPPAAAPAATTTQTTTTTTTTETKKEKDDDDSAEAALLGALIGFGVGVAVGAAVNDDYYYPHWGVGVYYGPRPFYPPAYVYRPVYGPAFRPAYGYASPPGYRNNYNNVRNNNVNININNNNNYYNRFDNNQNLKGGGNRSPIASQQPRTNQPRAGTTPANQDWKGQSNYAGARNSATNTRPAQGATATNRAQTAAPRTDRGYGASTPASRPATTNTPASRPATTNTPASRPAATTRDSAFSSAKTQGSGNFERAASARGNASVGSRPTSAGRAAPRRR
ncbi:MAG TPA: DUF3300 domain-containing protein [Terriglobia bacterium]|nr:DUF3300 domain-containing protein [Terriglobia bacterium]